MKEFIIAGVLLLLFNFSAGATPKTATSSTTAAKTTAVKSPEDPRLLAPWTAAIFQKVAVSTLKPTTSASSPPDQWKFLCSATITGTFTVITSARCLLPRVYPPKQDRPFSRPHHLPYSSLKVVAGLLSADDLSSADQFTQHGIVGQIRDVYDENSAGDTPEGDLAAIRLKNQFNFTTPYVKQVSLFETTGTLLEAKETKAGETFLLAGFGPSSGGVETRNSQAKKLSLKVHSVTIPDLSTCIERYTEAYPTYYFNILCGVATNKQAVTIPCHYQGAGLVKKVKDVTGSEVYQLFGVYSSNSALAKMGGKLNATAPPQQQVETPSCTGKDIMFFSKYSQLKRWAISNQFCDNELAMCKTDRCRPWDDLCSGQVECEDGSDENARVCFSQNKEVCSGGPNQFRCEYGACILGNLTCDGIKDCSDGSDESKELCSKKEIKGKTASTMTSITSGGGCEGIKAQETVNAFCSHESRPGLIPCGDKVPVGTKAVLRNKEVVVTCGRDNKWSRSTRLSC